VRHLLTREEVDALLASAVRKEPQVSGEGRVAPVAKPALFAAYDFKHPNRVSKDQVRKLELIHDYFAGALSSSLSTSQRSIVDVHLLSVEQVTYTEFIGSLHTPSCTYSCRLPPLEGLCVVDFNPGLALAMVDRLFGGRGTAPEAQRELTGIERSLLNRIVARVLEQLVESWDRLLAIGAEVVDFESNPQFMQIVPPGETVIVATLQVTMPYTVGSITMCYPHVALETVLDRLATQNWMQSSRITRGATDPGEVLRIIRGLRVPVDGQLAEVGITFRDLLALEPGTVIPLPVRVGEPVALRVAGRKKFNGTLGTVGGRRALRVEAPLPTEGD
jgi:flagellar motor switch protein FliM